MMYLINIFDTSNHNNNNMNNKIINQFQMGLNMAFFSISGYFYII